MNRCFIRRCLRSPFSEWKIFEHFSQDHVSPLVLQNTGTKLVTSHIWYHWKGNFIQNHRASFPIDPSFGQNVTNKNLIGPFTTHRPCQSCDHRWAFTAYSYNKLYILIKSCMPGLTTLFWEASLDCIMSTRLRVDLCEVMRLKTAPGPPLGSLPPAAPDLSTVIDTEMLICNG